MAIKFYDLIGTDLSKPFSPHCWKTAMCLAHKNLDYDQVLVPFTGVPNLENEFSKTVPVIRDGDKLVADSFEIALYLERKYPDRPSLFGGEAGASHARFVESWTISALHTVIGMAVIMDIHDMLDPSDQEYFRQSRESRIGKSLESVTASINDPQEVLANNLSPLRFMLKKQNFIGGDTPLFSDYIVFGALQWARVSAPSLQLKKDDSVNEWFDRCLDLYDGLGRKVPAAT